jgi:glucokinase
MLEVNEYLVLDFVRERGITTRPEVCRKFGLSPATVSRIVKRLTARGVVRQEPGQSRLGRPASLLVFNTTAGYVVGIDLGGTRCKGVLADLAGSIVARDERPTTSAGNPFTTLLQTLGRLREAASDLSLPVVAVAVGVPAIIDRDAGVAMGGPNVHWTDFPLMAELSAAVDVPHTVENDVKLAALAHSWRGDAQGCENAVTLAIGTGIGAAVVVDGRLAKGRHNAAGEVGYILMSRDQIGEKSPTGLGGFERVASGPMIAALARSRSMSARANSVLSDFDVTPKKVFAAAAASDPIAMAVVDELLDHVAMAIVSLAAIADPEVIVLEGSVGRALAPYVPTLQQRIEPHLPFIPRIAVSRLAGDATAIGAVAAAIELVRHDPQRSSFFQSFEIRAQRGASPAAWNTSEPVQVLE